MREKEADEKLGQRPIYLDVWRIVGSTSLAGALAVRIEHRARGAEGACTAEAKTLAAECLADERSVRRALRKLRDLGVLEEKPTARTTRRWLVRPPEPLTAESGVPLTAESGVTGPDPGPCRSRPRTLQVPTPDPAGPDPGPYGHPRKGEEEKRKGEEGSRVRATATALRLVPPPDPGSPAKAPAPRGRDREAELVAFLEQLSPEARAAVADSRDASSQKGPAAWHSALLEVAADARRLGRDLDEVLVATAAAHITSCSDDAKPPKYFRAIARRLVAAPPAQLALGAKRHTARPVRGALTKLPNTEDYGDDIVYDGT